jgi:periplasmic protein TonB
LKTRSTLTRTLAAAVLGLTFALSASATPKVVKKVPPEFPTEAAKKGISAGTVKAKLNVEADGKVSTVEILEAEPKRVFDRAVTTALLEWKFEPGEKGSHEVKLVFKNED